MEIISYVLEGGLEHRDSMGTGSVIRPGELQRISAGSGIYHSEFNASPTEAVHFYQIWLLPREENIEPSYEQKAFSGEGSEGRLRLVASTDGADGSLTIHQDVRMHLADLSAGQAIDHSFGDDRYGWLQVVRGNLSLNGERVETSDGAAISQESEIRIESLEDQSQVMLFDLP
jgi:redox-sensitive bicupin YhaK (pirin superfamily)